MDCPFCAIVQGRAPASVVAETERAVAFMDFRQMLPGHVLVVPRAHVENIYALDVEDAAAVTARAARALRAAFDPPGLNLWQSNGDAGSQEVPNFHLHVQPRRYDDRTVLEHLAQLIRPHIGA